MSNQFDLNQCNDMEAWWTVITSIYNFLNASTNLAHTLDSKYSRYPTVRLLEDGQYVAVPEEFPWFLQLLDEEAEEVQLLPTEGIIPDDQVRDHCKNLPEENFPHTEEAISDELEGTQSINVERAFRSMHELEQSFIQRYMDSEEKALQALSENIHLLNMKDTEIVVNNPEEAIKGFASDESCYFQFSDSEQTMESMNLQSSYESLEDVVQCPQEQQNQSDHSKEDVKSMVQGISYEDATFQTSTTRTNQMMSAAMQTIPESPAMEIEVSSNEDKHCPKCHKRCKIIETAEKCQSEDISSAIVSQQGRPEVIKSAVSETGRSKTPRANIRKNTSEIIPKNIDELKEHLNSINKSTKVCKNQAKTTKFPLEETSQTKNVNYTVFTAKVTYRGHQKTETERKGSAMTSSRFASVESVVKKLITGGTRTEIKNEPPVTLVKLKKLDDPRRENVGKNQRGKLPGAEALRPKQENISQQNSGKKKYSLSKPSTAPKSESSPMVVKNVSSNKSGGKSGGSEQNPSCKSATVSRIVTTKANATKKIISTVKNKK